MTPWTIAHKAPLFLGFPRQKYWSGLPFPSPGDLPDPRIKPESPVLQMNSLSSKPPGKPGLIHSSIQLRKQKYLSLGVVTQISGANICKIIFIVLGKSEVLKTAVYYYEDI